MEHLASQLLRELNQRSLISRRLAVAVAVLTPLLATSCSNQALFNSIQLNNRQRCESIPIAQQAACEEQYQSSYEEYRREREALLREDSSS